jgi:AraC-like DNA-binding protein
LELVQIGRDQSFNAWEHGYPFHTVRWHFHPELEIHYVVETKGKYFVGDFIGDFGPGNLVLTGPNLPHNWVSDLPSGTQVPLRGRVVQFTEGFLAEVIKVFPELGATPDVLAKSRRGALFSPKVAQVVAPRLAELIIARGARRVELFIGIMGALAEATDTVTLASASYLPDPSSFLSTGINSALIYINANLTEDFSETDLAAIAGRSPATFSRSFRRHTGMSFVQYVNRLRVNLACQLLMSDDALTITDICFLVGFKNISNFNRQFLTQKGMAPSRFRALLAQNTSAAA